MSTDYGGIVSDIESNLPAEINISSSTNTSPIVVTLSSSHTIRTNDKVLIRNHSTNTNANGYHVVGATASTTLELVGTTGNGVGGATGTCLSLAVGPTLPIPDDGDDFTGAAFGVPYEALADRTAFLWYRLGWAHTIYEGGFIAIRSGADIDMQGGSLLHMEATAELLVDSTAKIHFNNGGLLEGDCTLTAIVTKSGVSAYVVERRHTLPDSDQTLSGTDYDTYSIPSSVGSGRVYKLTTSPTPPTGRRIRFYRSGTATNNAAIHTDGGGLIATFQNGEDYQSWEAEFDGSAWVTIMRSENILAFQ
jgi:hypothetical protein